MTDKELQITPGRWVLVNGEELEVVPNLGLTGNHYPWASQGWRYRLTWSKFGRCNVTKDGVYDLDKRIGDLEDTGSTEDAGEIPDNFVPSGFPPDVTIKEVYRADPKPFTMSAGRCRLRDKREGVAGHAPSNFNYPWRVLLDSGGSIIVTDEGKWMMDRISDSDVIAMLPDEGSADRADPEPLVIEAGGVYEAVEVALYSFKTNNNYTIEEFMSHDEVGRLARCIVKSIRPHTPAAPGKPVIRAIEMDESWLFKWANWRAFNSEGTYWQFEYKPYKYGEYEDFQFTVEKGRYEQVSAEHAPTLPPGVRWQDTLRFVKKGGDDGK